MTSMQIAESIPAQFGVSGEQQERDWPLMTRGEVEAVLSRYAQIGPVARLTWHSPRPFSAAVLVTTMGDRSWFVKRHHHSIRDVEGLSEEHRFLVHLAARGIPVSDVAVDREGATAQAVGDWTYEVHALAAGVDAYRGAQSWTPFLHVSHAYAAGRSLARLHRAALDYTAVARPIRPLLSSFRVLSATDLPSALDQWVASQALLKRALTARDWRQEVLEAIGPYHARLQPLLPALKPLWTHGDWHASNLLWTDAAPGAQVRTVLDFGLSDRTCAVYDLALAIERNAIEWLNEGAQRIVHFDQIDAILNGYESLNPLSDEEYAALIELLPIVHTEFALSEVAYFDGILQSPENAEVAYSGYLIGHTRWFDEAAGQAVLAHLCERQRVGAAEERAMTTAYVNDLTHSLPILIEAPELVNRLKQSDLLVLDAHVFLPSPRFDGDYRVESGRGAWLAERIPGSQHADLVEVLSDKQAGLSFMCPSPQSLAASLGRLGVGTQTQIVIYDRGDGFWAARLWWMLRSIGLAAQVLNGGWQAWRSVSGPIERGTPSAPQPRHCEIRQTLPLWANRSEVEAVIGGHSAATLVCALSVDVYAGRAPSRYARRGHIPGSLNLPARTLVDNTGRYAAPALLREILAGVYGTSPIVLYCGGGISACVVALALCLLGHRAVRVYDGSLQEWAADFALPLATFA